MAEVWLLTEGSPLPFLAQGAPGLKAKIQPLGSQMSLSFSPGPCSCPRPGKMSVTPIFVLRVCMVLGVSQGNGEAEPQFQPCIK